MSPASALFLRTRPDRDIEEAIDFYLGEEAPRAAQNFIDASEHVLDDIEHQSAIGSTRFATELDLPGLRCWQIKGYPHRVFYIERKGYVDIWRVLHGSSDIPVWLRPAE